MKNLQLKNNDYYYSNPIARASKTLCLNVDLRKLILRATGTEG